jgi:hypothetical protein
VCLSYLQALAIPELLDFRTDHLFDGTDLRCGMAETEHHEDCKAAEEVERAARTICLHSFTV